MTDDPTTRVRFAPSPTGYLHVGGARTALFNWLIARKSGGSFVLRIEDTDRKREVGDSLTKILADLRWLGLPWDEGPEVGGDLGPYFQSQRLDIYNRHVDTLLESGRAYCTWETPDELAAARDSARAGKRSLRYRRPDPLPTMDQARAAAAAGKPVVVRFRMPGTDVCVNDEILGEVRMVASELEDFIIRKADGYPTYHFACVVDDALMKITCVIRGQEHLMNTPKHIALQNALGFPTPRYAHLPIIFNMNGSKMSKRDRERALAAGEPPPEIDVHDFRAAGYLPEAMNNFLALLGWSPGDDREHLSMEELVESFSIRGIGKSNARFDRQKLLAFNRQWGAGLGEDRLVEAVRDFARVGESVLPVDDEGTLRRVLRANRGFRTLADVEGKSRFLFIPDEAVEYETKAVKKHLLKGDGAGVTMLETLRPKLEQLTEWTAERFEDLFAAICESTGQNLGQVAQPLRVAVCGGSISPPIYDSLVLLGRERTLTRIDRCLHECRQLLESS